MRSVNYNTKQRDIIRNLIKNKTSESTIKDVYEELDKKIGLTTVYREVDKLVKKGFLNKTIGKDNITYYQYLEECHNSNHFFLKCEICGKMEHVDCDCINDLFSHILREHKFSPSHDHIIINGICERCNMEG